MLSGRLQMRSFQMLIESIILRRRRCRRKVSVLGFRFACCLDHLDTAHSTICSNQSLFIWGTPCAQWLEFDVGYNCEEVRGQWSYKIGPCNGVEISDYLWLSRYILLRCSERCNVKASFHAKPVPGDWNGNGAFVKFSTVQTRDTRNVSPLSFHKINAHLRNVARIVRFCSYGIFLWNMKIHCSYFLVRK